MAYFIFSAAADEVHFLMSSQLRLFSQIPKILRTLMKQIPIYIKWILKKGESKFHDIWDYFLLRPWMSSIYLSSSQL